MEKVSVIIPCYNSEKYIAETLESVFNQSCGNIEVIAVDDGSTDLTHEILNRYPLSKIIKTANRGVSAARDAGLEVSTGNLIVFLDSDDLLTKDSIERRVACIESSGAEAVYGNWQYYNEIQDGVFEKGDLVSRSIESMDADLQLAVVKGFWSPPANYLYRREVVTRIRWNPKLKIIQDARYVLDALMSGVQFRYLDHSCVIYRNHLRDSLSKRNPIAFVHEVFENTKDVERIWREQNNLNPERVKVLLSSYDYTARTLFYGPPELFKENLTKIYEHSPNFDFSWPKLAGAISSVIGRGITAQMLRAAGKPGNPNIAHISS